MGVWGAISWPPMSTKRRHDLPGEAFHRAHHARVLEIAEPEATVEVRDADHLLDALDLTDHRVRRADDQEAVEQIVDVGLLRRRHRDRAALLDTLVLVAERERYAHVPARLFGRRPRLGLAFGHVDGALDADPKRLRGLELADQAVEEPAELGHALDRHAEAAREHVEAAAHRRFDRLWTLRRDVGRELGRTGEIAVGREMVLGEPDVAEPERLGRLGDLDPARVDLL